MLYDNLPDHVQKHKAAPFFLVTIGEKLGDS